MKVLQFGFSDKGAHIHLPHRFTPDTVAYTGTHDNDTTQGWWNTASKTERAAVEALVGPVGGKPVWPLIRAASGQRRGNGHRSRAGSARAWLRSPHEHPRRPRRQLELARAEPMLDAGARRPPRRTR